MVISVGAGRSEGFSEGRGWVGQIEGNEIDGMREMTVTSKRDEKFLKKL